MATFLPYASCYGNSQALQLMDMNSRRSLSWLGVPPCLQHRRPQLIGRPPALTAIQLIHLIRILRDLRHQSTKETQFAGRARSSAVSEPSSSCHSKRHCLSCTKFRKKQAG